MPASSCCLWIDGMDILHKALLYREPSKNIQLPENWGKLKENLGKGQSLYAWLLSYANKEPGAYQLPMTVVSFLSSECHTEIALIPSTVWKYTGKGILGNAVQLESR